MRGKGAARVGRRTLLVGQRAGRAGAPPDRRTAAPRARWRPSGRARALAPNSEDVLSAFAQVALGARAPVPAILVLEPLHACCPDGGAVPLPARRRAACRPATCPRAVEALQRRAERSSPTALTLVGARARPHQPQEARRRQAGAARAQPRARARQRRGARRPSPRRRRAREIWPPPRPRRACAGAPTPGHATANLVIGMVRMKQDRYAEARGRARARRTATPICRRRTTS